MLDDQLTVTEDFACRVTLLGDSGLSFGALARTAERTLGLTDPAPLPIMMFAPVLPTGVTGPAGKQLEAHVEALISAGLHRSTAGSLAAASPLTGWRVCGHPDGLRLLDPAAAPRARTALVPGPGWRKAADEWGHVLVVYGLGLPMDPEDGSEARRTLFDLSRLRGTVAVGLVPWDPGEEN